MTMPGPTSAAPSTNHATTLAFERGRFRFALWQNVTVTLWTAQATLDAGQRILTVARGLARSFPQGRSQVMFIAAGAPAPDAATSELLSVIYDPEKSGIVCIAAVLEGAGFWASGIRSRMTSMRIAAGNKMVMRTFDMLDEVVAWLPDEHAKRTGVVLEPEALRAVLVAVRKQGTQADE